MKYYQAKIGILALTMLIVGCGGGGSSNSGSLPIEIPGQPNSLTVVWQGPAFNVDGTPLIDLAGFKLYGGQTNDPANMQLITTINNGGIDRFQVDNLLPGAYYFTVTAFNIAGAESNFSNVVQGNIQ